MNYKNDLNRIERFITKARLAAWGPKLQPVEGKRKVGIIAIVQGCNVKKNTGQGPWRYVPRGGSKRKMDRNGSKRE